MRTTTMTAALALLLAAAGASGQDTPTGGAAAAAADALKKLADEGCEVEVAIESDEEMPFEMPGKIEGGLKGKVGPGLTAHLAGGGKRNRLEIFCNQGRALERVTRGTQFFFPMGVTSDVLSLLDGARLSGVVRGLKGVREGTGEKLGETDCRVYAAKLPADALHEYLENDLEEADGMVVGGPECSGIELKLHVGRDDGRVRRIQASIERSFACEDGGEDEEGVGMTMSSTYIVTLKGHGTTKVELPADVRKLFDE